MKKLLVFIFYQLSIGIVTADDFINLGFDEFDRTQLDKNIFGGYSGLLPSFGIYGWQSNSPFPIYVGSGKGGFSHGVNSINLIDIALTLDDVDLDYALVASHLVIEYPPASGIQPPYYIEPFALTQIGTIPNEAKTLVGSTPVVGKSFDVYINNIKAQTERREGLVYANVADYAGQEVELKITSDSKFLWSVNNLEFSTIQIPEPYSIIYILIGIGLLQIIRTKLK